MKRSRLPLYTILVVLLFFYLPIIVLVANSFNASRYGGAWAGFSLKWYAQLAREGVILRALANSLLIAAGATVASTALGTLAAFALHRWRSRLQTAHYALIYAPLVMPEVLMGMSLLLLFVALGLSLSLWTILLAHVTFCISYVALVVLARLQDMDFTVIEAARDLGASRWQATRLVLLPMLWPGIAAGALLAFTLSIDDFVITFFVAGVGSTTLPIHIYSMIKHGSPPLINALSTLLLVATFALVWLSRSLMEKEE